MLAASALAVRQPAYTYELVPDWLEQHVPAFLVPLLAPGPLLVLAALSVLAFVASLVGVPYFLTRLPADYFSRRERVSFGIPVGPRSRWRVILRILRNLLGWALLTVGLLMLVLPGQGMLTVPDRPGGLVSDRFPR